MIFLAAGARAAGTACVRGWWNGAYVCRWSRRLSRSKALERSSMPRQPILVVRGFISINGEKLPCRHFGW